MKISLQSVLQDFNNKDINQYLGSDSNEPETLDYSKVAMLILLWTFGFSMIGALYSIFMAENFISKIVGLIMFLVCGYGLMSFIKEKSNLDLLAAYFDDLSESAKYEVIQAIVNNNALASSVFIKIVENLLNIVIKKMIKSYAS